ncbi:MAG TPA: N(4)-(beta-N-acetylglucosaminyl)-L-asparaginase [Thermoanaerobaculaceae bacterium]|mgnify:CR=1 FL=1|nr:N(4)-(beta-N-acetylglucosaminyl)-L-asparaginase [Thermoanaerobaculaceae bacterium]HPS76728.1 N(4)-(beta-N-acetylglucosaminyl)-L-asparaginase [Thermoanaerobaculaceae bacterium]
MSTSDLTRRDLLGTVAAVGAVGLAGGAVAQPVARPVAVGSSNALAAVKQAVERMAAGDSPVDAAVAGVGLAEADPEEIGVGYGGLPNEEGVVQLDAAVMDGVSMRAGAVAAIERIKHPAQVALAVMRRTTRVLLVGEGALRFARAHGFPEETLLTERARKIWLYWKENAAPDDDWLPLPAEAEDPDLQWFITKYGSSYFRPQGTIHVSAVDARGQIGCATTTSGLFFKLPGRVGDSPLVGCGLYCDGEVGSAGATGHGESCIISNGAATVVELMRGGKTPEAACLAALERVVRNTRAAFLKDTDGRPRYNLSLYAVNRQGDAGGASTWSESHYTVCRAGSGPQLLDSAYLFKRPPAPR